MQKIRSGWLKMNSSIAVDYLSFSVDLTNIIHDENIAMMVFASAMREMIGHEDFDKVFVEPDGWENCRGQRPYTHGKCNRNIGVFVWFGGQSNALVQFSGHGCKFLEKSQMLLSVISSAIDRLTRLDIAIDIETDTLPIDFVSAGYNNRIKSYGEQRSASGQTCYVGSRVSQKFCRVYRYSEPHPRARFLRVEYETKKAQAQIAAKSILANGLAYASESLTKYYDWKHADMPETNAMVEKMQAEVTQRSSAKTLYWLLTQVAPAIRRLIEDGTIENPDQFFNENFMPDEGDK